MAETTSGNEWLRQLVEYIKKWIDSSALASEPVPVAWINGPKSTIHGSPNQKWLQTAAALLTGDPWWIDFALQRYDNEFKVGHQEIETLTGSHSWQHLTAHTAIRYALRYSKPLLKAVPKDKLDKLRECNDRWFRNEAWLMAAFYSHSVQGCVSVGARDQPPGFPKSSQKDAFASFMANASKSVQLPKNLDGADIYCQILAAKLISLGDDLEKGNKEEPKLWSPVWIHRVGDAVTSFWSPPAEILGPAYFAEVKDGKASYAYEPFIPADKDQFKKVGA